MYWRSPLCPVPRWIFLTTDTKSSERSFEHLVAFFFKHGWGWVGVVKILYFFLLLSPNCRGLVGGDID